MSKFCHELNKRDYSKNIRRKTNFIDKDAIHSYGREAFYRYKSYYYKHSELTARTNTHKLTY